MMQASEGQQTKKWWAEGDTFVHNDSRVAYLVDGRSTMLVMCRHFLKASKYIYLANWGMTPKLELVRGDDRRPGSEQACEALVSELREEGLSEADIAFWMKHDLSVQAVLGHSLIKSGEVKRRLW